MHSHEEQSPKGDVSVETSPFKRTLGGAPMKGRRTIKLLGLVAIIAMAFVAVTGAAFAAPLSASEATGQDQVCPHDTDGWSSHQDPATFGAVEGAVNYCVKGGSPQSACTGYLETGSFEYVSGVVGGEGACGLSHWSYQLGEPETDPASVSVELGTCRWSEAGGSQTPFSFDISGNGTFTINGSDYTSDGEILLAPGTYGWTFVPAEGYHLVGPGSGSVEVLSCEPPPPGGASGSFTPYCGGGINVVLTNAWLYIDDFDPFDEGGSYPLNVGEHTFLWEALQGFEFPEGFTTEGTFTVEPCGPPEEPPTGPESALPIGFGVALLGSFGLITASVRRFLKK